MPFAIVVVPELDSCLAPLVCGSPGRWICATGAAGAVFLCTLDDPAAFMTYRGASSPGVETSPDGLAASFFTVPAGRSGSSLAGADDVCLLFSLWTSCLEKRVYEPTHKASLGCPTT